MQEGVIQYQLTYVCQPLPEHLDITLLEACRARLFAASLIGQDEQRYAGLGYGNLSQRVDVAGMPDAFLITGSQTGHLPALTRQQYALVTACDPQANRLQASGEIEPSSEAMTHAVIYQSLPSVQAVIHVHWPDLWQNARKHKLWVTAGEIPYGTPQMAAAVQQLVRENGFPSTGLVAMLGHEDGIIAWGKTLAEAEARLTYYQ